MNKTDRGTEQNRFFVVYFTCSTWCIYMYMYNTQSCLFCFYYINNGQEMYMYLLLQMYSYYACICKFRALNKPSHVLNWVPNIQYMHCNVQYIYMVCRYICWAVGSWKQGRSDQTATVQERTKVSCSLLHVRTCTCSIERLQTVHRFRVALL